MRKTLSKAEILSAKDCYFEYEDVPEWGGSLKIYSMSLRERMEFEKVQAKRKKDSEEINLEEILFVLSKSLRDEDGIPIFTAEEVNSLLDKNMNVVYRIFKRCAEVNKVDSDSPGVPEGKN